MKKLGLLVVALVFTLLGHAQEKWSLQKCIDYALANNITIRQGELNTNYQQNELEQAKNNRLPDLNARASQSLSFGRSAQADGTYKAQNIATTGVDIGTSMVLYSGNRLKYNIYNQDINLKKSLADLQKAKDDVTLNLASGYLEILFAKELIKVSETQVQQTKKQIERTSQLVQAGKIAPGALLEMQAQLAGEELDVVNRQNTLQMTLLNLAQLLELDSYSDFDIETPKMPEIQAEATIIGISGVFEKAVENRPEIKSADYQLQSAEIQLKIAKSALYPTLTASAGFDDGYFNVLNLENESFINQLQNKHGESLRLGLSIPIFNKFQNKTNIENSKLQIMSRKLELESTKKELRKQIEQAYTSAKAALNRYAANKVAVKSMQESFRYVEEKFNVGMVNSVEYNDAKTKLASAESNLIQAKYDFIFRSKILEFYSGIPITLSYID